MIKFTDYPIRGIDVSEYNGSIDWSLVKANFTAIRVGHGRVTDLTFKANWAGAKGKTHRLPYWYMDYYSNHMSDTTAYGISDVDWGIVQAEKWWSLVKNDPSGIVFLDIEKASIGPDLNTVKERVLTVARAFLERADALSGKFNGMYLSLSMTSFFTDWFKDRPLWVAWYNELQTRESVLAAVKERGWKGKCLIWQYASHGDMDADGDGDGKEMGMDYPFLDLNIWLGSDEDWKAFKGEIMTDILLNIQPLAQRDPRWANIKLGTSTSTIGNQGCLMTDETMLLRYLLGIDIDPGQLNDWLKANGGYHEGNLFVWDILKKYDPRITFGYRYERAALDKIDEQLAKRMPVIVNVDLYPNTPAIEQHWVLVVGKMNGRYIIHDPWFGAQLWFDEWYGDPRTGVRIVCTYNFSGTIPPPVVVPPQEEGEVLFRVKVKEGITKLVIRSAPIPEAKYDTKARAKFPEEYDVFEEKNGYGRIGAGRWISMDPAFVEKVTAGELTMGEKVDVMWAAYLLEHE